MKILYLRDLRHWHLILPIKSKLVMKKKQQNISQAEHKDYTRFHNYDINALFHSITLETSVTPKLMLHIKKDTV